jgi:sarcosine oxidase subunit gamma
MSETPSIRHGLESFLESVTGGLPHPSVHVSVRTGLGHVNLRGDPHDPAFATGVAEALGQALPTEPNTATLGAQDVFWLGPDEWLIVTARPQLAELLEQLRRATQGRHACVNDISGGQVVVRLSGPAVRDVLARGCTLDLNADTFDAGRCAQTGLAKAPVLIGCVDAAPVFDIVVRRSFAEYLCRWIDCAAREFGVSFDDRTGV